jgi:hypothetical protein
VKESVGKTKQAQPDLPMDRDDDGGESMLIEWRFRTRSYTLVSLNLIRFRMIFFDLASICTMLKG